MITGKNFYDVLSALVPLYITMFLSYTSVKYWKIFTPDQCSGINRFVAVFAIPFFSFHFISNNNPYTMNLKFIAADSLQKLVILVGLGLWQSFDKTKNLDWKITLFSLSTLPNTLVMGVPLLGAMYGETTESLMIQVVVMQAIVWYTFLLFMYEYRAAKVLIAEQFPKNVELIESIEVESDVLSLDCRNPVEVDAEVDGDGRFHVVVRKSNSARSWSNISGAEIFSLDSFGEPSVSDNGFMHGSWHDDLGSFRGEGMKGSKLEKEKMVMRFGRSKSSSFVTGMSSTYNLLALNQVKPWFGRSSNRIINMPTIIKSNEVDADDPHMFVWNSSATKSEDFHLRGENFSHLKKEDLDEEIAAKSSTDVEEGLEKITEIKNCSENNTQMPPASIVTRLILIMVWRKLIRNPNTYASVIGLVWSLLSYRWHFDMPIIVANSIKIFSDVGLGMAMFSLGLFMALQSKIISCGKSLALFSMGVRFLAGPLVMAATSLAIGIRGNLLRICILQAALPQGIVPFVFAKEYNLHPQLLSTAVIFGMIVALPILIIYYILLGL